MLHGTVHNQHDTSDSVVVVATVGETVVGMELFSIKTESSAHAYWTYNVNDHKEKELNALLDWFDPHFYAYVDGMENDGGYRRARRKSEREARLA